MTLRSFRICCQPEYIPLVEDLLQAEAYAFEPEPFSAWARRLLAEPVPLGSSLAMRLGLIYIQDRSSMLPPLALNPQAGTTVLDMCASPGSKTGFLAQLVGSTGFVLANEPNATRLGTLRSNMESLNLLQVATCSFSGESLPLPDACWSQIQLDPPCSGWGTAERNPAVLRIWKGDKIQPLISLQQSLLKEAYRLLKKGGSVVYSTCTTNVSENECQVQFARELGFTLRALEPFAGFHFETPQLPDCDGVLRVCSEASQAQGFFIARLQKGEAPTGEAPEHIATMPGATGLLNRARFQALAPTILEEEALEPKALPAGLLAAFNDSVRFLPDPAFGLLPDTFRWRGANIGKAGRNSIRFSPRLRVLLPSLQRAREQGIPVLNLSDIVFLRQLLCGQSLNLKQAGACFELPAGKHAHALLYWKSMPLARLKIQSNRVLWAER